MSNMRKTDLFRLPLKSESQAPHPAGSAATFHTHRTGREHGGRSRSLVRPWLVEPWPGPSAKAFPTDRYPQPPRAAQRGHTRQHKGEQTLHTMKTIVVTQQGLNIWKKKNPHIYIPTQQKIWASYPAPKMFLHKSF